MKDLHTFKTAFLSDRVKELPNRLEYHGQSLDNALNEAKRLIEKHGLNLIARTTGDMAQQRRFEVIIKN